MQGAVLILAAGSGSRYGSDKRQARTPQGKCLLATTIALYRHLPWPIYVVTRQQEQALHDTVEAELKGGHQTVGVHWIAAPDAALGMGHSLSAGIGALLADGNCAAIIGLGDMPFVQTTTLARLLEAMCAAGQDDLIVRPRYLQQPGNPVALRGAPLHALLHSCGDAGARPVLNRYASRIQWLDVDDPGILQDIDLPADLRRY